MCYYKRDLKVLLPEGILGSDSTRSLGRGVDDQLIHRWLCYGRDGHMAHRQAGSNNKFTRSTGGANGPFPQNRAAFNEQASQAFNNHSSVWIPGAFLFSGFLPPIEGATSNAVDVGMESLPRLISTPAPATKVRALGFSTDTVI